jgi:hypothetical protein
MPLRPSFESFRRKLFVRPLVFGNCNEGSLSRCLRHPPSSPPGPSAISHMYAFGFMKDLRLRRMPTPRHPMPPKGVRITAGTLSLLALS